ncbi:cation:proton antiporter [Iamia majanohamensis]|uniref:Cation:proton antiporter n=1 Tax=Iamia majanohamensis TaxID=467976 RepID=A0AAF0BRR1_9ACTN|nr:cation:proton antiporter [Iamia majanohamensis]WCO67146.1 cation:proton antiporter [Iamia majanohamensis]
MLTVGTFAQMPPTPFTPSGAAPGIVVAFVLLDVVLILVAARLCGAVARKVGQPAVVGEIVAGVLLGPSLLGPTLFKLSNPPEFLHCDLTNPATNPDGSPFVASVSSCLFPAQARGTLGILGQIALIFFMFLVGIEVNARSLRGKEKGIGLVSIGVVVVPVLLAFAISPILWKADFVPDFGGPTAPNRLGFTLFVGAMLTVSAFPVMARILQEKGLTTSPMGAIGVASAGVVTVLMFLIIATADGVAKEKDVIDIGRVWVITAVYLALMLLVVKRLLAPLGRVYERAGTITPDMFAIFIGVAVASGYVADRIGINVIVGGFMAGLVIPEPRKEIWREMSGKIGDLTAIVLLPIFLAFSGLATDFTKLSVAALPGIAALLVAAVVGKLVGGAVFARLGGLSWAEGTVLGVLLNCRGLLVLVAALVAVNAGAISPLLQLGGVVVALVTTAMTGPLFDATIKRVPTPDEPEPEPLATTTD